MTKDQMRVLTKMFNQTVIIYVLYVKRNKEVYKKQDCLKRKYIGITWNYIGIYRNYMMHQVIMEVLAEIERVTSKN